MKTAAKLLRYLASRLVEVHGEDPDGDHILAMRREADALDPPPPGPDEVRWWGRRTEHAFVGGAARSLCKLETLPSDAVARPEPDRYFACARCKDKLLMRSMPDREEGESLAAYK